MEISNFIDFQVKNLGSFIVGVVLGLCLVLRWMICSKVFCKAVGSDLLISRSFWFFSW